MLHSIKPRRITDPRVRRCNWNVPSSQNLDWTILTPKPSLYKMFFKSLSFSVITSASSLEKSPHCWVSLHDNSRWVVPFTLTGALPKESEFYPPAHQFSVFLYKGQTFSPNKGGCKLCTYTTKLLPPPPTHEFTEKRKRKTRKREIKSIILLMIWLLI